MFALSIITLLGIIIAHIIINLYDHLFTIEVVNIKLVNFNNKLDVIII